MKVLITGANGMVARAAAAHCRQQGDETVALTRQELDITDRDAVRSTVADVKPDAVFNCAAYTDVDGAESDPDAAQKTNADGVAHLAQACLQNDARFVTISTDYVFDGSFDGFYTQRHTPKPKGVYAESKRRGEIAAQIIYSRSIVVRSGWIYGEGGTNFLSVMHRLLAEGKQIKAIEDAYGTPTFADDLAKRLRELAELDLPGIYHATNSGAGTSYLGFAQAVCRIGDYDPGLIRPVSNDDLKRPAPRPKSSRLACLFSERLGLPAMPDWERSLAAFVGNAK